jgi:hypothetical protein
MADELVASAIDAILARWDRPGVGVAVFEQLATELVAVMGEATVLEAEAVLAS